MSKSTVSADGGAMPARGLKTRRAAPNARDGSPVDDPTEPEHRRGMDPFDESGTIPTMEEGRRAESARAADARAKTSKATHALLPGPYFIDFEKQHAFVPDREVFDHRHHALLAALAELDNPNITSDERLQQIDNEAHIAEMILFMTPAAISDQVWVKVGLVERIITEELRYGAATSPRLLIAFASLKHDLTRFDFGEIEGPVS